VCGLGLRSAVKVVKLLNDLFHLGLQEIPSYTGIKGWVEKSGYFAYKHSDLKSSGHPYGLIIDESMQIGNEKLLLSLGVKADKTDESALTVNDVEVLDISVEKNWNGALICDNLKKVGSTMGNAPSYVVSDNASIMNKGIRDSSLIHLRDVGHTLAMFLERQYKNASDFLSFTKALAKVKNREILRPVSYLLPPKQRVIARFMNLTPCLRWADKMLHHFDRLSKEEQSVFRFLKNHAPLVQELSGIVNVFNHISKTLKEKGLSRNTACMAIWELRPLSRSSLPRVSQAAKECIDYLLEEAKKLRTKESKWHISSDILESVFGVYKARKSPNALHGVTSYVFMLPLLTKSDPESGCLRVDCKKALESVFLRDIDKWAKDNLSENLAIKRRCKLMAA
jgi:lambda repressor-like predicted transcriptional regulator